MNKLSEKVIKLEKKGKTKKRKANLVAIITEEEANPEDEEAVENQGGKRKVQNRTKT